MKTRTTIITIAALAILALAATAYAGPGYGRGGGYGCPGWGGGNGPGYGMGPGKMNNRGGRGWGMGPGMMYGQGGQQLTPEQYEKLQTLSEDFGAKAEAIGKKLYAKDAELDAAYAAENVDINKVKSLAAEIGDLRGDLFELRAEYRARLIGAGIIGAWQGRRGPGSGPGFGFGPGNCPMMGAGPGPDAMAQDTP